jgi:single-strand DNA-binding protein
VTTFGNQAELCEKYLRKGFLAGASGRIRAEQYTDSEGIRRYPVSITADNVQFLQWPDREQSNDEPERSDAR